MKEERNNPNPNGKEGKPFSLAPLSFDEAVRKMLEAQPPKAEVNIAKPRKKAASKR